MQPVNSHAVHASACAPRAQLDWTKLAHHLPASTCQSIPQHACATLDSHHPHVCSCKRVWQQFPHCNCRLHDVLAALHARPQDSCPCCVGHQAQPPGTFTVLCIKLGSVEHANGKQQNIQRPTPPPLYTIGAAHARTWHCKDCRSGLALHHADGCCEQQVQPRGATPQRPLQLCAAEPHSTPLASRPQQCGASLNPSVTVHALDVQLATHKWLRVTAAVPTRRVPP